MDYQKVLGLGVAGNFAGHLEQAGEARDFANVKTAEKKAPKALFPFYLPNKEDSFLKEFPLSKTALRIPNDADKVQIEPEIGIVFKINYDKDQVASLQPLWFGAYNDCSIRREGAKKISEKKNWGADSKGYSPVSITIDTLAQGGVLDDYRIASFLIRGDQCFDYGIDSAVRDYSYFHEELLTWIVDHMNNQKDEGPMENIHEYIQACGRPEHCLISIGATRYNEFGEKNYLQKGDLSVVLAYSEKDYTPEQVKELISSFRFSEIKGSLLVQRAV